jgi:hypothetical protein
VIIVEEDDVRMTSLTVAQEVLAPIPLGVSEAGQRLLALAAEVGRLWRQASIRSVSRILGSLWRGVRSSMLVEAWVAFRRSSQ